MELGNQGGYNDIITSEKAQRVPREKTSVVSYEPRPEGIMQALHRA
jgi:hypothetical protein